MERGGRRGSEGRGQKRRDRKRLRRMVGYRRDRREEARSGGAGVRKDTEGGGSGRGGGMGKGGERKEKMDRESKEGHEGRRIMANRRDRRMEV